MQLACDIHSLRRDEKEYASLNKHTMSAFQPPNFRNNVATQSPDQRAPASPPRMGYVSGAEAPTELVGYVGTRPAVHEEPGNPQSRRQTTNFASPDAGLANSAFTQSQFTNHTLAAAAQSAAMRASNASEDGGAPIDPLREGLRRFKESNGGRPAGSCGMPPSMQQQQRGRLSGAAAPSGRGTLDQQRSSPNVRPNLTRNYSDSEEAVPSPTSVVVAHNISDPEMMYKAFTGKQGWFRVAQLIVPAGKKPKKISISSMFINNATEGATNKDASYALRIVNPTEMPPKTLWSFYNASNTNDFQVFSTDCPLNASSLLEVQAVQDRGAPVLVSTILAEYE